MRNLFRIYLEKPELAGFALLILLAIVFDARSGAPSFLLTTFAECWACCRRSGWCRSASPSS